MAAEYRAKFPGKAIICDFDAGGWAFLCAGGSIPKLPRTTDARLLKAIPRMQPWPSGSGTNRWTLRERGQQCLICLAGGAKAQVDLSEESGVFRAYAVNPRTGELKPRQENIRGGGLAKLLGSEDGLSVVWIVKE